MAAEESRAGYTRAVRDVVVYTLARLALFLALTAVVYGAGRALGVTDFPLLVAAMLALVVSMPLGMWLFAPLRRSATESMEVAGEQRRKERAALQAKLRGENP